MTNRCLKSRLLNCAAVTTAVISLLGYDLAFADVDHPSAGSHSDGEPRSPIKHVIVIVGENRTFDHIFATYQPKKGEYVDNLLSKGIIRADGTPGPHYEKSIQYTATDTSASGYLINPPKGSAFDQTANKVQAPGTSYAFKAPYSAADGGWQQAAWDGPGALSSQTYSLADLAKIEYGLPNSYLPLLYTGATGVAPKSPDSRILNYNLLPPGPYPLVCGPNAPVVNGAPVCKSGDSLYDTYGGSPVHRFFQMWQQFDCAASHATKVNPTGCLADLFPWVEMTVAAGSNGAPPPSPAPVPLLKEGDIAMGFYNVAKGDAPYLTELANKYTLADNYHQGVMGGTYANFMMLGYADALYFAEAQGKPAKPSFPGVDVIENPNPMPGTNNWYTQDGYGSATGGGSYVNCADKTQPGVAPIADYLHSVGVKPNCETGAYYLVNNFVPAYTGAGDANIVPALAPYTLPPVRQRHIGDALTEKKISWAYFGERWNDFKVAPQGAWYAYGNPSLAAAYLYCNICNPFLYSASIMTDPVAREVHNKDVTDLYDAIAKGDLPAVSYVKPSLFTDGHPASSKMNLFEGFTKKIIDQLKANKKLWDSTAVFVTVDEGGGYYDSGYVQPVDFFGDGTRIPLIVVSKYSKGGHVAHEYSDHASIIKFIEKNWGLGPLTGRSRDNLPNPKTEENPYVPVNRPAIGDLTSMFNFDHVGDDD
jgi:phospholipase C